MNSNVIEMNNINLDINENDISSDRKTIRNNNNNDTNPIDLIQDYTLYFISIASKKIQFKVEKNESLNTTFSRLQLEHKEFSEYQLKGAVYEGKQIQILRNFNDYPINDKESIPNNSEIHLLLEKMEKPITSRVDPEMFTNQLTNIKNGDFGNSIDKQIKNNKNNKYSFLKKTNTFAGSKKNEFTEEHIKRQSEIVSKAENDHNKYKNIMTTYRERHQNGTNYGSNIFCNLPSDIISTLNFKNDGEQKVNVENNNKTNNNIDKEDKILCCCKRCKCIIF